MTFKSRKGFSLVELLIASLIFGFMTVTMVAINAAINKQMFHNYRANAFKSDASIAMKDLTNRLQEANRIDQPALNSSGAILAFAVNVDQMSGCYPINAAEASRWHYFCHSGLVTPDCPSGSCIYHHTGPINGGGGCPNGPFWDAASYPVTSCGTDGGGTVTLLASYIFPSSPAPELFSRRVADGITASNLVKIKLRVRCDPATDVNAAARKDRVIDTTLDTTVRLNRAGLPGQGF